MKKQITSFMFMLCLVAATVTSCKKDNKEGGGGTGGGNGGGLPSTECVYAGKIASVPCGTGVFGNLWILTDKGEYYQPCDIFPTFAAINVKEGDMVKFGYHAITTAPACETKMGCNILPPKSTKVKITCLSLQTPPAPQVLSAEGTLRNYAGKLDGCSWVMELVNSTTKLEVAKFPQGFIPKEGGLVKVTYTVVGGASVCMVGTISEIITATYIGNTPPPTTTCTPFKMGTSNETGKQPVSIKKAIISGTCLKILVAYSGCASSKSNFNLYWNGNRMESLPVQVNVQLGNLPALSACTAYYEELLMFDVSKLKTNPTEKIRINLAGWNLPIEF